LIKIAEVIADNSTGTVMGVFSHIFPYCIRPIADNSRIVRLIMYFLGAGIKKSYHLSKFNRKYTDLLLKVCGSVACILQQAGSDRPAH